MVHLWSAPWCWILSSDGGKAPSNGLVVNDPGQVDGSWDRKWGRGGVEIAGGWQA